ncbi:YggT family protein [Amylibacter sp.]|jgi:YggT family protein|nr:YggT family protein [Rhodobacterales bacterium]MDA8756954.1 YggT family protein [Amylibacter sp.]MBT4322489.1 YggT family protein [Rhodobacterales bacterium]MDA9287490.1 YggT family protein [Amylibacter sp.]MDA9585545.1 YggT family protein [Amylibacter sp.]
MNSGGSGISEILIMALDLAWWIVIIQFIMSWLVQFNVLNLRQPIVAQAWFGINRLTSPIYDKVRRYVPSLSGIDFTPIIVIFAIRALQVILYKNPF